MAAYITHLKTHANPRKCNNARVSVNASVLNATRPDPRKAYIPCERSEHHKAAQAERSAVVAGTAMRMHMVNRMAAHAGGCGGCWRGAA